MAYKLIKAKPISYGGVRTLSSIKYIVIHYTGVSGDTAKNSCLYFKNGNTRYAGAHFFVDQTGSVYQSIPIDRVAWSVGGSKYYNDGGSLYGVATNYNTVSIEMCDNLYKDPSAAQTKAVRELVAYIQKRCPNAKTIIRHWDVNGKPCPARMAGRNNAKWTNFKKTISSKIPYKVKVTKETLEVYGGAGSKYKKKGKLKKGKVYTIVKENKKGTWGKLKSGLGWIALKYTKRV